MAPDQESALCSNRFFTRMAQLLESFFAAYGSSLDQNTALYWISKTKQHHTTVRYVFLSPDLDIHTVVTDLAVRLHGVGIEVLIRTVDSDLSFLHASEKMGVSNTLVFLRRNRVVGVAGVTTIQSSLVSFLPVWGMFLIGMAIGLVPSMLFGIDLDSIPPDFVRLHRIFLLLSMVISFLVLYWFTYQLRVKSGESLIALVGDTIENTSSCRPRYGGQIPFKFPQWVPRYVISDLVKVMREE